MIVIVVFSSSCYYWLLDHNFSVESIKIVINVFLSIMLGFGWIIYATIKNKIKPLGDLQLKLKISILGILIALLVFIILHFALNTNIKMLEGLSLLGN